MPGDAGRARRARRGAGARRRRRSAPKRARRAPRARRRAAAAASRPARPARRRGPRGSATPVCGLTLSRYTPSPRPARRLAGRRVNTVAELRPRTSHDASRTGRSTSVGARRWRRAAAAMASRSSAILDPGVAAKAREAALSARMTSLACCLALPSAVSLDSALTAARCTASLQSSGFAATRRQRLFVAAAAPPQPT